MIGYVILITVAVVMGVFVYQWIKTYVPIDGLDCPEGTSLFIKDANCVIVGSSLELNLSFRNNGRFDVAGYFIHATNASDQTLATIDLSLYNENTLQIDESFPVLFGFGSENELHPGDEVSNFFEIPEMNSLYLVEVIPVRFQEERGKTRVVSCGNVKINERISCN